MHEKLIKIKSLDIFISDGNYSSKYPRSTDFVAAGIPFIRANNISNGTVSDKDMYFITEEKHLELLKGHVKTGDVLITNRGNIGQIAIVPDNHNDSNLNAQVVLLRPNSSKLNNRFLKWILQSDFCKRQFDTLQTGTALKQLPIGKLKNVEIKIFDIHKQVEMADILDNCNKIITKKKNQLEEYDHLIKSRFVEMFVDKYEKIQVSTKLRTTSGGTPKSDQSEYYANGTIPWLTSGEVNQGRIEKTEKFITEKGLTNSSAKWIPKKSIVIAMYGATAGKVGIIEMPTTTNQAVCAVLPQDEYNPEYLRFAFEYISEELAGKAVGGGQPNISQAIIKDSLIFNPPLEVQIKFSVFVQHVDKLKFVVQKSLDETQKLFDSLMQEYFG